jgi:hypothetical protein
MRQVEDLAMSLLELREIRTSDLSRYRHDGSNVRLGIGTTRTFLGFASAIEINSSETAAGQRARGSAPFGRFYVARQIVVEEKSWHLTVTGGGAGRWVLQSRQVNLPDDPDPAVIGFDDATRTLSFYDNPGFPLTYLAGLGASVQQVCLLQNFRLWCEVARPRVAGAARASVNVLWNHYLCLGRTATGWKVASGEFRKGVREMATPPN